MVFATVIDFFYMTAVTSFALWLCIHLHDIRLNSYIGASQTSANSPWLLYLIETLIPVQNTHTAWYHGNAVWLFVLHLF